MNICFENLVILFFDLAYAKADFESYRHKKYGKCIVWYGTDSNFDHKYDYYTECMNKVHAVCSVLGIEPKIIMDIVRIENRIIHDSDGMKCLHESDYKNIANAMLNC